MKFNEARKIVKDMQESAKVIADMVDTMGIYAINHYKKSFTDGGFTDVSFKAWKQRKRSRDNEGRAILVKTGNLKRSLTYRKIGRYSVRIESNVPYAKVHNEGLRSGRGRGFTMPERKFVGHSERLSRKIELKLRSNIENIFK
jgi:phage gpG-like protein